MILHLNKPDEEWTDSCDFSVDKCTSEASSGAFVWSFPVTRALCVNKDALRHTKSSSVLQVFKQRFIFLLVTMVTNVRLGGSEAIGKWPESTPWAVSPNTHTSVYLHTKAVSMLCIEPVISFISAFWCSIAVFCMDVVLTIRMMFSSVFWRKWTLFSWFYTFTRRNGGTLKPNWQHTGH